jgi:hypothetical protein
MDALFKLFDQYPAIPIGMLVFVVLMGLRRRRRIRAGKRMAAAGRLAAGMLAQVLFWWTPRDPFTVRDLLNGGSLILGRAGSGKTSSSGRMLMQAIVDNPNSGGLILAAKPEDAADVRRTFRNAGRPNDLIVFDADGPWRTNFLQWIGRGQTRNVVQALMMIGQSLKSSSGKGNDDKFWEQLNERYFYNAVAALQAAGEPITPDRILNFLMAAATSPEQLRSEAWQQSYHGRMLERAIDREKTPLEEGDFRLCMEFWVREYPVMDPRTRGNGMSGVMNVLHTFNTGVVREMVASNEPNVSPDDVLAGKWLLVNFPPSTWGAVGSFINAGFKYLVQLAVLQRQATEKSPFVTVWCDEAHQVVNDFDGHYIAQCRSHRGCLVYLTQSVSSFYAALRGREGEHQANALLANFSHAIIHPCDPETAKWASSKLGQERKVYYGGGTDPGESSVYDELFGQPKVSSSFSEQRAPVLEDWQFMTGRTGGPDNSFEADSMVIRSGERFSDGKSYQKVTWSQRG